MPEVGAIGGLRRLDEFGERSWNWLAACFGLWLALTVAMLLWWAVFGLWDTLFDPNQPFGLSFDGRNHLTLTLLLAFVASGTAWVRASTLRDIQQLGRRAAVSLRPRSRSCSSETDARRGGLPSELWSPRR